jgi:hypothetical protein
MFCCSRGIGSGADLFISAMVGRKVRALARRAPAQHRLPSSHLSIHTKGALVVGRLDSEACLPARSRRQGRRRQVSGCCNRSVAGTRVRATDHGQGYELPLRANSFYGLICVSALRVWCVCVTDLVRGLLRQRGPGAKLS